MDSTTKAAPVRHRGVPVTVWHATPVLRCMMEYLPRAQQVALLDADVGCRASVGAIVWLSVQGGMLRGPRAQIVCVPPLLATEDWLQRNVAGEWRLRRWLAGYLVQREVAPPMFEEQPWLLRAQRAWPMVWVPEFGAEYAWGLRCVEGGMRRFAR